MLSTMVLLVLILILAQIKFSTDTGARVSRNEETLIIMDHSIESALLQVYEDLRADGESAGTAAGNGESPLPPGGSGGEGGEQEGAVDSREDEWAKPKRTQINELQLRILIQDEDSKFNILSILTEDENEAEKAFERLTRIIELSRRETDAEIDGITADRMATMMLEFMNRRQNQYLPDPALVSDEEDNGDIGLPLSLREFVALDPELFPEDLFRDFRDSDDLVVHSLGSFLTVWSSVGTLDDRDDDDGPDDNDDNDDGGGGGGGGGGGDGGGGDGGGGDGGGGDGGAGDGGAGDGGAGDDDPTPPGGLPASSGTNDGGTVNINTAPAAVLHGLIEDRDLPYRFWEDVIEFRNDEDEEALGEDDDEDPPLDEYGEEITTRRYFSSSQDLSQIDGWENIEPILQGEMTSLFKTESNVFSIFITARKPTGEEQADGSLSRDEIERQEAEGQGLVRTVRSVVWRRVQGSSVVIFPLIRWEVLDYVPYEVLDYPGEDR